MYTQEEKDDQALALLEEAGRADVQQRLLPYCRKLTSSDEAGRELYQQACLNAHDYAQRKGWAGTAAEVRFLLVGFIRTTYSKELRTEGRYYLCGEGTQRTPDDAPTLAPWDELPDEAPAPDLAPLAARIGEALQQRALPERIAFRLHLDGYSSSEIESMTRYAAATVRWQVRKIKEALADRFRNAYYSLVS